MKDVCDLCIDLSNTIDKNKDYSPDSIRTIKDEWVFISVKHFKERGWSLEAIKEIMEFGSYAWQHTSEEVCYKSRKEALAMMSSYLGSYCDRLSIDRWVLCHLTMTRVFDLCPYCKKNSFYPEKFWGKGENNGKNNRSTT